MKTIKPLRLMVMPRPYRWRDGTYLAVTIAALVEHVDDQPRFLPEYTLLHEVLPELDCDEMFDSIMPKPHPEFLVSGYAYTAHQKDKTCCMVRARVADKVKEGLVFGERYWNGDEITKAQPFEQMPLTWSNAFGGSDFELNPLGTGLDPIEVNGLSAIRLPNLETPLARIHRKGQRVPPFNLGQIRMDWPQRLEKMGSCDQAWIERVGIGFFDNMQFSAFNAAPEDQIWQDRDALRMDETFEMWNMHPERQCWSGELPAVRARCFIKRRGVQDAIDEIRLKPTTVWFVPHRSSYLLLFHGHIEIATDDAYDVDVIMAAMEKCDAPRALEDYARVMRDRCDLQQAALHVFRDEQLMPGDMLAPWIERFAADDHAMLSKMTRMSEERQGYPEGKFVGPIKPVTLADLPEMVAQHDKLQAEAMQELAKQRDEAFAAASGSDAVPTRQEQATADIYRSLDFQSGRNDMPKLPVSGPPSAEAFQQVLKTARQREATRAVLRESPKGRGMDTLSQAAATTRRSLNKVYLYSVHFQEGVARVGDHRAHVLRQRAEQRYRLGKNLSKMNLTGADLRGMDFSGADFTETWLENADFTGANLTGAKFDHTVLARATFADCRMDDVELRDCNISEATFDGVSMEGVSLRGLISEGLTVFRQCRFIHASIENFDFKKNLFAETVFDGARLVNVSFQECKIEQCEFNGSLLQKSNFNDSSLNDVAIHRTKMLSAAHMNSAFAQVAITECEITKTSFYEDVSFNDCELTRNHFRQSMLREVSFVNVDFSESVFEQTDLSLANLQRCRLRRIKTPQAMFIRANLDMADLSGSNLMHGSFQKARFIGANLSDCNLFRADMSETVLDASTRTDRAYVHRTRLAPFHDGGHRMDGRES
ncbi:DUF2169 family type VI secretion system accessory protein [Bordetella sp. 02P26C-1]|uniref:DUF2169 family type VI secretion system accessory protein n=1 Tax=Bordetella sp. 02P26C-1 TaxID=2683195 RepID=UPI0013558A83|nr:DUF2169 domain-containing protein [Bordetella sp. 02P26C-1]MVW77738.1 DUF2169 domain-containing protein [Bordetella sp. 02P26C-1]